MSGNTLGKSKDAWVADIVSEVLKLELMLRIK